MVDRHLFLETLFPSRVTFVFSRVLQIKIQNWPLRTPCGSSVPHWFLWCPLKASAWSWSSRSWLAALLSSWRGPIQISAPPWPCRARYEVNIKTGLQLQSGCPSTDIRQPSPFHALFRMRSLMIQTGVGLPWGHCLVPLRVGASLCRGMFCLDPWPPRGALG